MLRITNLNLMPKILGWTDNYVRQEHAFPAKATSGLMILARTLCTPLAEYAATLPHDIKTALNAHAHIKGSVYTRDYKENYRLYLEDMVPTYRNWINACISGTAVPTQRKRSFVVLPPRDERIYEGLLLIQLQETQANLQNMVNEDLRPEERAIIHLNFIADIFALGELRVKPKDPLDVNSPSDEALEQFTQFLQKHHKELFDFFETISTCRNEIAHRFIVRAEEVEELIQETMTFIERHCGMSCYDANFLQQIIALRNLIFQKLYPKIQDTKSEAIQEKCKQEKDLYLQSEYRELLLYWLSVYQRLSRREDLKKNKRFTASKEALAEFFSEPELEDDAFLHKFLHTHKKKLKKTLAAVAWNLLEMVIHGDSFEAYQTFVDNSFNFLLRDNNYKWGERFAHSSVDHLIYFLPQHRHTVQTAALALVQELHRRSDHVVFNIDGAKRTYTQTAARGFDDDPQLYLIQFITDFFRRINDFNNVLYNPLPPSDDHNFANHTLASLIFSLESTTLVENLFGLGLDVNGVLYSGHSQRVFEEWRPSDYVMYLPECFEADYRKKLMDLVLFHPSLNWDYVQNKFFRALSAITIGVMSPLFNPFLRDLELSDLDLVDPPCIEKILAIRLLDINRPDPSSGDSCLTGIASLMVLAPGEEKHKVLQKRQQRSIGLGLKLGGFQVSGPLREHFCQILTILACQSNIDFWAADIKFTLPIVSAIFTYQEDLLLILARGAIQGQRNGFREGKGLDRFVELFTRPIVTNRADCEKLLPAMKRFKGDYKKGKTSESEEVLTIDEGFYVRIVDKPIAEVMPIFFENTTRNINPVVERLTRELTKFAIQIRRIKALCDEVQETIQINGRIDERYIEQHRAIKRELEKQMLQAVNCRKLKSDDPMCIAIQKIKIDAAPWILGILRITLERSEYYQNKKRNEGLIERESSGFFKRRPDRRHSFSTIDTPDTSMQTQVFTKDYP